MSYKHILAVFTAFLILIPACTASAVEKSAGNAADPSALLRERLPLSFAVLEADFPADLRALLETIEQAQRAGMAARTMPTQVFGELTAIRKKYAAKLLFAPGPALQSVLIRLAYFYDDVLVSAGPGVCGRFAQDGSGVLFDLGVQDQYWQALDLQTEAYLSAVVQAIETPEYYGVAADADWGVVFAAMVGRGSPLSYVATISAGDRNDPDLCPALAAMFRTSAALDAPEGARTRADLAQNLTGY